MLLISSCGLKGYGNSKYRIGDSNADNPTFTPLLYDPALPVGQRFTQANMPTSNIGRLYHSVAYVVTQQLEIEPHILIFRFARTLLPSGEILIGGSNPNDDMETRPWPSEYRVEYLKPVSSYIRIIPTWLIKNRHTCSLRGQRTAGFQRWLTMEQHSHYQS